MVRKRTARAGADGLLLAVDAGNTNTVFGVWQGDRLAESFRVSTDTERTADDAGLRWSVVSMVGSGDRDVEHPPTNPDGAKAALDRIVIPQDALDRIAAIAPRSSLIVTDEGVSPETGKGTEFVVVLSGEPQGGIKKRRRNPGGAYRYVRQRSQPYWGSPFGSPFNW